MRYLDGHLGLYTDLYELTMAQAYFLTGRARETASFDYFFRKSPFNGGYVLFAGLETLLSALEELKFDNQDVEYLRSLGFKEDFLDYLRGFRFEGDIFSVREGEVVFPNEPVIRVSGNILETQLIETLLLNIINFQSLIATKASRIKMAAGERLIIDFGLRRAQSLAGIYATRAAFIGGVYQTSNVYSARMFNIKPAGTMAHSFVQSFETELEAFEKFSLIYPDRCILLVDTYNTLKSGIPNAIKVAKKLESQGTRLIAVRLDSGDMAYLSKKVRKMLDEAGLKYVKIVASNKLDEYVISELNRKKAPIDIFGVGTNLVIGHSDGALDGVYKLVSCGGKPKLKISEEKEKILLPGDKNIKRFFRNGEFLYDLIHLEKEEKCTTVFSLVHDRKQRLSLSYESEQLLKKVMEKGRKIYEDPDLNEIASYARSRLKRLPKDMKKLTVSKKFKVYISKGLYELRKDIIKNISKDWQKEGL